MIKVLGGCIVGLMIASSNAHGQDAVSCVQGYLSETGYPVGVVDGQLGRKTKTAGAEFSGLYFELGLPELTTDTAQLWCTKLGTLPGQTVREERLLPAANAPAATIAKDGGLNFSNPLVKENFGGQPKVWHDYERSLWPGRVTVDVDTARIRSGEGSIRMRLLRGDCGWTTHRDNGGWNDCEHGNVRVDLNTEPANGGEMYYGLSVMLGGDILALSGRGQNDVNLFQWYQYDAGACFNLQYHAPSKQLNMDVRCESGNFNHVHRAAFLGVPEPDVWIDFVVHVNWTKESGGYFQVLQDGQLVMDYAGPTLATEGRPLIVDHAQIYAYGNGTSNTASQAYRTAMTVWFDDMIRSKKLSDIEDRYSVPEGAFDDGSRVAVIRNY